MTVSMSASALYSRFRGLDANKDGLLEWEEFYEWISEDDCDMTRGKAEQIFQKVDSDGDGKLSFGEFVKCCKDFMGIQLLEPKQEEPAPPAPAAPAEQAEQLEQTIQPVQPQKAVEEVHAPVKEAVVPRKKAADNAPRKTATTEGAIVSRRAGSLPNLLTRRSTGGKAGTMSSTISSIQEPEIPGAHKSRMAPPLPTPGPGAYNNTVSEKVPGGSYFGTGHITVGIDNNDTAVGFAQEKTSFIKYDLNRNGTLDYQELCKLLRRGDPNLTDMEVQALFDALDKDKDGNVGFNELSEYLHPPGATFEHSTWRKKLRTAFNLSCPGPADYVGNDKALAGKRNAPRAVIPSQRRMTDHGVNSLSPGPAAYKGNHTASAFHKNAYSATFGTAPKGMGSRSPSPGPGSYVQNFSVLAHQKQGPRATIGAARRALCYEGHVEPSPGPATYCTNVQHKVKGGNYFGVPGRMSLPDLPYEKRQFASCDANKDGTLGADEVYSILCQADPRISAAEAKQIFDSCDRDGDGKINFDELRDYLHPVSANENTAYRKVMRDGFSVKSPGPLDYDTIAPRNSKIRGGSIGRARR